MAPPNEGEWLVVMLELTNQSEDDVELTLEDFVLTVDGADLAVDRRSTVVASIMRLPGAPDSLTDTVRIEPGEPLTLPLVFQVPAEATDLTLRYGETELDLSSDVAAESASTLTRTRGYLARSLPPVPIPGPALELANRPTPR